VPVRHTARHMVTRAPRRRTTWANFDGSIAPGAIGSSASIDLLNPYRSVGGIVLGTTVLITHLKWFVTSAVANGDGFGLGLIVDDLGNVFTSQVNGYNTLDTPYEDWMLADRMGAHPAYGMTTSNNQGEIHLRSKRKIEDLNRSLLLVTKNSGATASLSIAIFARVLLALP